MKKTYLSFGLIAGAIIIAYSFVVYLIMGDLDKMTFESFQTAEKLGYLRYLIMILALVFAMRTYRKQSPAVPTYGSYVKTGVQTSLIIAILIGLMEAATIMIYPDMFNTFITMMEKSGNAAEAAKQKQAMEGMKWMFNPAGMGIFYFLETFIIGTIASLLIALFFRSGGKTRPAM